MSTMVDKAVDKGINAGLNWATLGAYGVMKNLSHAVTLQEKKQHLQAAVAQIDATLASLPNPQKKPGPALRKAKQKIQLKIQSGDWKTGAKVICALAGAMTAGVADDVMDTIGEEAIEAAAGFAEADIDIEAVMEEAENFCKKAAKLKAKQAKKIK